MKKLILLLCLIIFSTTQAFAACDYSTYCTTQPYDLSSKGGEIASNVTGVTFLTEKIVEFFIKKEIKKATKENFKVELKTYSAQDLAHGRFKSLKISGKNLVIDDAYLTSLEAKTLCNFNYIDLSNNQVKFKENMVMGFKIEISNTDLKKTVQSAGYLNMLNRVKLSGLGITFFKLQGANIELKNNKLYFTINLTSPLSAKPIPIVISSDLKVEDGNIVVTKVSLVNLYTAIDLSKATSLLNILNPLTFSTDILNNKNSKMSIQTVNIIGDRIFVTGNILIPKNVK